MEYEVKYVVVDRGQQSRPIISAESHRSQTKKQARSQKIYDAHQDSNTAYPDLRNREKARNMW